MDFTFLSDKIKARLAELQPETKPLCVIRGSGGFNAQPGESYIIPYADVIYLYDRRFSDPDFQSKCLKLSDIDQLLLHNEPFSALLSICVGKETVKLKISSAEIPNAELMLEKFESCREVEEQFMPPRAGKIDGAHHLSPMLGLVVILMFVAAVDDDIAKDEQEFIERFCGGDTKLYNKAYEYYQKHTLGETIACLALDEQQKMCYLANILELAMADGIYDSREQKMIETFTAAAGLDKGKVRTIEDVLLIKNQLSVLT
ncbi:MAG: hypothetical protein PHV82_15755 [Victivallaceae bacterium]|nr:hypothetical protein [Victivallaceae bacterium]